MAKVRLDRPFVLGLAVALLGTLVFLPAISGGFVWDDNPLIVNNPYVHSLHWWPRWFTHDFWNVNEEVLRYGARMIYWRPLVTATYALDWSIGGGSPLVFHIANFLFHATVGALAFYVLRRWIGAAWPAFAAALLFAVHPTKAESVAWIAGRTDILCMIAVFVATQGIARRLRRQRGGLALELAGTIAAYMCKEQAIVLPVFAAVETWVLLDRPALDRPTLWKLFRSALPQAAVAVAYIAIRMAFMPIRSAGGGISIPLVDHIQVVLESIGRFVTLTFAPHELSVQQGLVHIRGGALGHDMTYVAIGAVALAVLLALAVLTRRRYPIIAVGIGFYLATLFPTSNVKYTEMATLISERFLYLPSLGIALAVGGIITMAGARRRIAYLIVAAAIVSTGMQSLSRSADYRDERAFWERELALHPDSQQARHFKVQSLVKDKKFNAALVELLEVNRRQSVRTRDYEISLAMQVADLVSRLVPDHDVERLRAIDRFLADLLDRRFGVTELEVLHVRLSFPLDKLLLRETIMQPQLLVLRASVLGRLGDDAKALELVQRAVAQCGECVSVIAVAALVYARNGQYEQGLALLDKAKRLVNEKPIQAMQAQIRKARDAHQEALRSTGPIQLQRRATELATLELYGRAYDVLAPHKEQIKRAPAMALGFAELAFRAGEPAVAREVLAGYVSPDEVEPQLQEWAATMGWTK